MIEKYRGHYNFNSIGITLHAPNTMGVYYCGKLLPSGGLKPLYIGRAKGEGVSIQGRLRDHLADKKWSDVTHFGYQRCTTATETDRLEKEEIRQHDPMYNIVGKPV